MDNNLIKKCVESSTYFDFISLNPFSHGQFLLVKTKDKINGNHLEYFFQLSDMPCDGYRTVKDESCDTFTWHPIFPNDQESANMLTLLWNFLKRNSPNGVTPATAYAKNLFSKKPSGSKQKTETLAELLDRWGRIVNLSSYKKYLDEHNQRVTFTTDKPIKIHFNPKGETYGYNVVEKTDNFTLVKYDEDKKDGFIKSSSLINGKFVGLKIGDYDVSDNDTIDHRVSSIPNGERMLKTINGLKVAVVGLGGVGSMVVETLYKKGVRNFKFFDSDTIEESNRSRLSILAKDYENDTKKVNIFDGLNADITKYDHFSESNADAISDCHIIIICVDNYEARQLIGNAAIKHCVPFINLGIGYEMGMQKYRWNAVLHPTEETVNMPSKNTSVSEYKDMENLQMAEGPLLLASQVGLIVTSTCGLYDWPNIDNFKGKFNEKPNKYLGEEND